MAKRYRVVRFNDFKTRISGIYMRVHIYHLSHDRQMEILTAELYNHPDWKRLTRYELGYLRGLMDAKQNELWNAVIWRLGPSSGPTRDVHTEWTEEMSALCRIPGALYGGHFWKDKPDIAYTPYACTNAKTS